MTERELVIRGRRTVFKVLSGQQSEQASTREGEGRVERNEMETAVLQRMSDVA